MRYQSDCHVHTTCSATDSLILLVSFCPWMRVHPWMFWICIIVLLYWLDLYVASTPTAYNEYWLFPFSSPPCLLVLILYRLALYYWIVLTCIIDLYYCYCIYTPTVYSEYRFHSLLTHLSACVCISLAGRTLSLRIDIVYYYLHIATDINIYYW